MPPLRQAPSTIGILVIHYRTRQFIVVLVTLGLLAIGNSNAWTLTFFLWMWVSSVVAVTLIACVHDDDDTLADHMDIPYDSKAAIPVIWCMIALAPLTLIYITVQSGYFIIWDICIVKSIRWLNKQFVG